MGDNTARRTGITWKTTARRVEDIIFENVVEGLK
jgi:hypothetical protein